MDFETAVKELTELAKNNQNMLTQADLAKYCSIDSADYDKLYTTLSEEFEIQGVGYNFDGKINESIYINNNIGDITLMVNDNIENYKVNTTNIIGSVLINGKNNENVNNGDKMISVKNIVGSISVNF